MTRVLVVEDEESYSDALAYMLRKEGYEVAIAADGRAALGEFDRFGPDIVLLDLMLPGIPGTEVCRQIRQSSSVPVIMVSAKDDEVDKVVGLELGADDYVTKPYSPRELVARIRAVLRRGQEPDLAPDTLEAGPVRMDVERHVVTVDGQEVDLADKSVGCTDAAGKVTIGIGSGSGTSGIGVVLSSGDSPEVESVGLGSVDGVTLGYQKGVGEGSAEVDKDGSTYKITGEASGVDLANPTEKVTKSYEIEVTCP